MSNVPKLKKRAGEFEQKKQFDKALAVYLQILEEVSGSEDEADVALFNRVGDLMLRQGNVSEAVDHYERAVDLYAEGGFFNNAIALCNKILRNAPGRNSIYYKLGKISAKKGFTNDAKQNFLEYADRMQKSGKLDEAFRALKEFADLCPDQDDIRLMLADQLVKKDRKGEAIEQLQVLYERYESEGRSGEARATVDRMKAIDPAVEPQAPGQRAAPKSGDLVFLDVGFDAPAPPKARPTRPAEEAPRKPPPARRPSEPVRRPSMDGLPMIDAEPPPAAPLSHGARTSGAQKGVDVSPGLLAGFEQTSLGADASPPPVPLLDIEPTALGGGRTGRAHSDLPLIDSELSVPDVAPDEAVSLPGELPMIEIPDTDTLRSAQRLDLIMPEDEAVNPLADLNASGSAIEPDEMPLHPDPSRSSLTDGTEWEIRLEDSAFLDDTPSGGADLPLFHPTGQDGAQTAVDEDPAAARSALVERLRDAVADDPGNWQLHRQLGEALLEDGDREGGIDELEIAMVGFESTSDHASARAVADEILHLDPNSVRHHQKRVEYSFLLNDKTRLVDAYLQLADCLFRNGHEEKAQAVYQRVIDIAPDDARAQAALAVFGDTTGAPPDEPESSFAPPAVPQARTAPPPTAPSRPAPVKQPPKPAPAPRTAPVRDPLGDLRNAVKDLPLIEDTPSPAPKSRPAPPPPAAKEPPRPAPKPEPRRSEPVRQPKRPEPKRPEPRRPSRPAARHGSGSDDDFVNLSDWLSEDKTPKSTRMVADVREPESDQVDFSDMLERFKQGIAENVSDEDHEAHYDLGVAYKEMGLLDEAIAEFQKALRGIEHRIRTFEALGQCFIEKGQYQIAVTILSRAPAEPGATDEKLVGVLYLLGYASEALQKFNDALAYYERVFAVDITFRDVNDRLAALERVAK
jgi:tetratricopeptide (TPR) repeat protein